MSLVVDCHLHVIGGLDWFPPDRGAIHHWHREVRWRGEKATPEYFRAAAAEVADLDGSKMIARLDEAGIDIGVTMPMDHGYRVGDVSIVSVEEMNQRSCEIAANSGGRIVSFCGVDPRRPGAPAFLRRAVDEWGAKGLKLYPTNGFYPDDAELCYPLS